jgi:hypothetical protein
MDVLAWPSWPAASRDDRLARPNGGRRGDEHPALPASPEELAQAPAAAIAAGAQARHLHARTSDGKESLLAADIAAAGGCCPPCEPRGPIGVSTAPWITDGDIAGRRDKGAQWVALDAAGGPNFASVNVRERVSTTSPGPGGQEHQRRAEAQRTDDQPCGRRTDDLVDLALTSSIATAAGRTIA